MGTPHDLLTTAKQRSRGSAGRGQGAVCRRPARERSHPSTRPRGLARRQHAIGAVLHAVSDGDGARRGMLPGGRRRSPLRRLLRRVYGGPVRPFRAAHPGGLARSHRPGPQSGFRRRTGGPARSVAVRALSLAGARALHQQRHRGQHDGAGRGADISRATRHSRLPRRLSRRAADAGRRRQPDQRAVPRHARRLQRYRANTRGSSRQCWGDRRRHPRAHDGLGRLHTSDPGIPGRATRRHPRGRHPPGLRRGDDQQAFVRGAAEAAGRNARPHDAWQVHGRRHELWRLRRPRRRDGPFRWPPSRRPHPFRHLQQQCDDDGRRPGRHGRDLRRRGGRGAVRARRAACARD